MATYSHHTALLLFLITFTFFRSSEAAGIAVYWGQNDDEGSLADTFNNANEGSLADTCNTGNYQIVIIAYLSTFGGGQTPVLDLAGHCNPTGGGCTSISNDIKTCQGRGIKVLLSIGGPTYTYRLNPGNEDAANVSRYLWNNFLGGSSDSRPLGDAVLDGIDFDIQFTSFLSDEYPWDQLARDLSSMKSDKKVYLSAAPRCFSYREQLMPAIETGVFDFIWVKFYNTLLCSYWYNTHYLKRETPFNVLVLWDSWKSQPGGQIFMGLPAGPYALGAIGYMPPDVLNSQVLPVIKASKKYGGVMLWNRFYDLRNNYSSAILPNI